LVLGLALSRDAHWMFDEYLWSVDPADPKLRVVVADQVFTEWGDEAYWLKRRQGQALQFLQGVTLRPAQANLRRHWEVFQCHRRQGDERCDREFARSRGRAGPAAR
jgi:hypothetical protein